MPVPHSLAALCCSAVFALSAGAQGVVINEFSYNDNAVGAPSYADEQEFVELYNAGKSPVDISGWALVHNDPKNTAKPKTTFKIPAKTILAPNAFYVMGGAKVTGVNLVLGQTDLFGNSQGGLSLVDKSQKLVDSVVYEANKLSSTDTWAKPIINGDGIWGNYQSITHHVSSWSRVQDGYKNGTGRDWVLRPQSIGKTNNITTVPVYFDNFDKGVPSTRHPGWHGSFVHPQYANPAVVNAANPNKIPPSPQGGNCLTIWDPTGGGNTAVLLRRPLQNMVFEAYIYLDTTTIQGKNFYETWSIGVQGSTDTYFNLPSPDKAFKSANGNTGVSATCISTTKGMTLYLIDHNDGGVDCKVLGKIAITKGKNDGWQRIRLEVTGQHAGLWLGGTMGQGNGEFVGGTIKTSALGDVYIGYREYNTPNSKDRPVTIDDVRVRPSAAAISYYGSAAKTSNGTVMISPAAPPILGTNGFGIMGFGLAKSNAVVLSLGAGRMNIPLAPVFPAGTSLYTNPIHLFPGVSNAMGEVSIPLPLPSNTTLNGAKVNWQLFSFDPSLKVGMPLAGSQGCETLLSR